MKDKILRQPTAVKAVVGRQCIKFNTVRTNLDSCKIQLVIKFLITRAHDAVEIHCESYEIYRPITKGYRTKISENVHKYSQRSQIGIWTYFSLPVCADTAASDET